MIDFRISSGEAPFLYVMFLSKSIMVHPTGILGVAALKSKLFKYSRSVILIVIWNPVLVSNLIKVRSSVFGT